MHIDVNGTRLWFDVDGRALVPCGNQMRQRPVVVLVHGGPRVYDHSYFKPDFARLAGRAQVVYLDLRRHGRLAWGMQPPGASRPALTTAAFSVTRPGSPDRSSSGTRWAGLSSCSTGRATPDMRPGSSSSPSSPGGTRGAWSRASAASQAIRSQRSPGAATRPRTYPTRSGPACSSPSARSPAQPQLISLSCGPRGSGSLFLAWGGRASRLPGHTHDRKGPDAATQDEHRHKTPG
jgi:hypothetical protein